MITFLFKLLWCFIFGQRTKGEKANYVNNSIQPKLKKWQQQ